MKDSAWGLDRVILGRRAGGDRAKVSSLARLLSPANARRAHPELVAMISVSCTCGRRFKAEDQHAGKRTKCPVCGNLLVIGQAPAGSSGVNDNGEVPSWWFPT